MKIIIGGDIVPTKSNFEYFNNGNVKELIGEELLTLWRTSDIRIFNLETPLSDIKKPIHKSGPNLVAPTSSISGIKALRPSLITLANNHILDQDIQGLESTIKTLDDYDLQYIGVGNNIFNAPKPKIIKFKDKKIGVYACTEHEFNIATKTSPGANPFDPFETLDHIKNLKSKTDFVIVLYHGGIEHYRYPSPYLQKVCRKMVEKGADLIICQHSHAIGSYENYLDSNIIYGQGNFIFDMAENEFWNSGLLIEIEIETKLDINFIPIVKKGNVIRLAKGDKANEILEKFHKRSEEILKEGFIEETYVKFAKQRINRYLTKLSGFSKWKSRIDRHIFKNKLIKKKYSKKKLLAIKNYIKCESHNELLISGIESIINDK